MHNGFSFFKIFFSPGKKKMWHAVLCPYNCYCETMMIWYRLHNRFWIFSSQHCRHYCETNVSRTYKSRQSFIGFIPFFLPDLFFPGNLSCDMQLYGPIRTISVKLWWYHIDCRFACMPSHSFLFFRCFFSSREKHCHYFETRVSSPMPIMSLYMRWLRFVGFLKL